MVIRDLMTLDPVVLHVDDSLDLADMFMNLAHIRHLPVVDGGRLVGLITHRDLIRVLAERCVDEIPGERRRILAHAIMRKPVTSTTPDTPVRDAIRVMLGNKYGCLPVIEHERLVGIVTEADFLKLALESLE